MTVTKNLSKAMTQMFSQLFVEAGSCPNCGKPLFRPKAKNKDGSMMQATACPNCGWSSSIAGKNSAQAKEKQWTLIARKNDALAYFKSNSIVENKEQFSKDFNNYRLDTPLQKAAMQNAQDLVHEFLKNPPVHSLLRGKTGRGKSHLAMSMAYYYMKVSHYQKSAAFVNWPAFLKATKKGMGTNEAEAERYANAIIAEFDKVDLLVVDDFGVDIGMKDNPNIATPYTIDVATSLFSSRSERNLIVTTNLKAPEMQTRYGNRVVSRMLNNLDVHGMNFDSMGDYRQKQMAGAWE